jgi:hypothetical protein
MAGFDLITPISSVKFTPRGKLHLWGQTILLEVVSGGKNGSPGFFQVLKQARSNSFLAKAQKLFLSWGQHYKTFHIGQPCILF